MDPGEVFVVGSGSFAAEIADWAAAAGFSVPGLIEILDTRRIGTTINGIPVVSAEQAFAGARAVLGLGGVRRDTWDRVRPEGWLAATVVHPAASLARDVQLGDGVTVGPRAVVGAATVLGDHALVSRGALVGHHVRVGQFANLNPGVNIGGNASIGSDVFVGMGATVVNEVKVGDRAVIGAGAVVLRDVEADTRVQGVPARAVDAPVRAVRQMRR